MSVLVVGVSHKTAPGRAPGAAGARRRRRPQAARRRRGLRARHRGDRGRHLQPARDLRRRRPLPRQRRGGLPAAGRAGRRAGRRDAAAPLRPLRRRRRLPPVPRRVRPRLDGRRRGPDPRPDPRRAARRPGARHRRPGAERRCSSRRCGSASAPTPRPTSTGPPRRWSSAALDRRAPPVGRPRRHAGRWSSVPASMAALAIATVSRRGRRRRRGRSTAPPSAPSGSPSEYAARAAPLDRPRPTSSAAADLRRHLHRRDRTWWSPRASRPRRQRPIAHDRPGAAARRRPGRRRAARASRLVDLAQLADDAARDRGRPRGRRRCAGSSTEEVAAFLAARRQASVTPTVVALRSMATAVVDAEMERLDGPAARPRRRRPRRGPADRPPGRRQAAAPADRAGQGAGQRGRCGLLRRRPGRAVRPRPGGRRRRHPAGGPVMTAPTASGHPRLACSPRTQSGHGRRPGARSRLGREVELVEVTTEGDCQPGPAGHAWAAPASSSARCATPCCAATSTSPCTPSRTCRPPRADGIALAAVPAPRGPARRRRRPRRPHPGRAAGRRAASAPGSPRRVAQLRALGLGLEMVGDPRQRRHPDRQGRRGRARRRRARPGRAGPARPRWTRSPRCSTRCRCCPPPARVPWRSSAAPPTPTLVAALAALDDAADPGRRHRRAGRARHPRGGLLGAGRGAGRGRRGRGRRRALGPRGRPVPRRCPRRPDVRLRFPRRRRRRRNPPRRARCSTTAQHALMDSTSEKAAARMTRRKTPITGTPTDRPSDGSPPRCTRLGVVRRQRPGRPRAAHRAAARAAAAAPTSSSPRWPTTSTLVRHAARAARRTRRTAEPRSGPELRRRRLRRGRPAADPRRPRQGRRPQARRAACASCG